LWNISIIVHNIDYTFILVAMLRAKRLCFYCSEKDKVEHYENNFEMWGYEFIMGFMFCNLGMPCKATFHVINDEKVTSKIGAPNITKFA
jgi:hypothetical protein